MKPIEGYIGLYRDDNTNAIINTDDSSYNEYLKSKNRLIENQKRIDKLENEISEIKSLLMKLIEK